MKKNTNNEKVNKAFETLRTGVIELINNPAAMQNLFKEYGTNYEFNTYSPRNTMILMFETMLRKQKMFQMARGYKQWKKDYNRTVKKGEKAMYILAPQRKIIAKEVNEETGEEIKHYKTYFKAVPVFELSQTEGEPIQRTNNKNNEYKSINDLKINDFVQKAGVEVEFDDLLTANGYTDGRKIVIGNHNDDIAGICTLFHELAHYNLHYEKGEEMELYSCNEKTNFKELEAEAVAFMVSSALGIENNYSKKYIAGWNEKDKDLDEEFEKRSYKLLMEALSQIDLFIDLINA